MIDLFRAEWSKVTGSRWLTGCMIWIWPIFGLGFIVLVFLLVAFDSEARNNYINSPLEWTFLAMIPWAVANENFVRFVLLGFAATIFASEYRNQTWKMVIPGNSRVALIFMKFVALSAFIVLAFGVLMLVLIIGGAFLSFLVGADYPPALSSDVISEFLGDLALNASLTFVSTFIWASLAGLLAILTRSILFGVIGSIFLSLLETLSGAILSLAASFVWEALGELYVLTPTYNVNNILSWVNLDTGIDIILDDGIKFSLGESIIMVILWMIALFSLTIFAFQRQDLS